MTSTPSTRTAIVTPLGHTMTSVVIVRSSTGHTTGRRAPYETVIYLAHVMTDPSQYPNLGTYAGLAHLVIIDHLNELQRNRRR